MHGEDDDPSPSDSSTTTDAGGAESEHGEPSHAATCTGSRSLQIYAVMCDMVQMLWLLNVQLSSACAV